ncbi:MAG: phosphate ABC transporter permease subunit PstC [Cellulosilyticaceae bacterium]
MKRYYDKLFYLMITLGAIFSTLIAVLVFFNIFKESLPFLQTVSWESFLLGDAWKPLSQNPSYGMLPMIIATLYISFLAVCLVTPIGIGCAIFLSFCIRKETSKIILSFIDMLAGVPSVIFGFMGLILLVKFMENHLSMTSGESVLAGGILLATMLLPYIVTGCTETLEVGKEMYYLCSLSLGVSKWYTLWHMILPFSASSLIANMLLAFGRAMGETMAVMMVIGNSPIFPKLMGRAQTIPSLIALELGTATYQSTHYASLYTSGLILILLLILIQLLARLIKSWGQKGLSHEK